MPGCTNATRDGQRERERDGERERDSDMERTRVHTQTTTKPCVAIHSSKDEDTNSSGN